MVNGEGGIDDEVDDDVDEFPDADVTVVISDDVVDDDEGEMTAEVNVDELVAKVEMSDAEALRKKREARKRFEELQERLREDDEFGSTYNFDVDEDLLT